MGTNHPSSRRYPPEVKQRAMHNSSAAPTSAGPPKHPRRSVYGVDSLRRIRPGINPPGSSLRPLGDCSSGHCHALGSSIVKIGRAGPTHLA
jgi:hypothetical protein